MVTPIMTNTSRRLKNVGRWIIGKAAIKVGSHFIYSRSAVISFIKQVRGPETSPPPPNVRTVITLRRRAKSYPHRGTGVGSGWNPLRSFRYVSVFWNDFTFSGKPLIFLTKRGIFYGWWRCWRPVTSPTMVTIVAAILDFNWMVIFVLYIKNNV